MKIKLTKTRLIQADNSFDLDLIDTNDEVIYKIKIVEGKKIWYIIKNLLKTLMTV